MTARICLYPDVRTDGIGSYVEGLSRELQLPRIAGAGPLLSPVEFLRGLPAGYDLVHVPHFVVPMHKRGAKCVCTIQDVTPLVIADAYGTAARRYLHFRIGWSIRHADHLIFTSESTLADTRRLFGPLPPSTLIPLAVDPARPVADGVTAPDFPFFFCIGRRRPHKNSGAVITAFAATADRTGAHLLLAGAPDIFDHEYRALVDALNVGDRVHFTGLLSPDALAAHYRAAIALVYPSRYEGFGLPILEAMSYGCPVITSTRASMPEVAGANALLVDPDDAESLAQALLTVAADRGLRQRMALAGPERAARFTWRETAQRTAAVYQEVLERRRG
jgi:glycosyltransferase involved in cell wall biosynthesis